MIWIVLTSSASLTPMAYVWDMSNVDLDEAAYDATVTELEVVSSLDNMGLYVCG